MRQDFADRLVFERTPQPLDEDIVHAPAPAIHRDPDAGRLLAAGEGEAGKLTTPVRSWFTGANIRDLRAPTLSRNRN